LVTIPRAPQSQSTKSCPGGRYRDVPGHYTAPGQIAFFPPGYSVFKNENVKVRAKYDFVLQDPPSTLWLSPPRLLENEWNAQITSRLGVVVLCMIQKCRHIIAATKSKIVCWLHIFPVGSDSQVVAFFPHFCIVFMNYTLFSSWIWMKYLQLHIEQQSIYSVPWGITFGYMIWCSC